MSKLIKTVGYRYYCDHCSRGTCRKSVRRLYSADRAVSYVCDPCYEGAHGWDCPWEELPERVRAVQLLSALNGTTRHMAAVPRRKAGGYDYVAAQGRAYARELATLPPLPLP